MNTNPVIVTMIELLTHVHPPDTIYSIDQCDHYSFSAERASDSRVFLLTRAYSSVNLPRMDKHGRRMSVHRAVPTIVTGSDVPMTQTLPYGQRANFITCSLPIVPLRFLHNRQLPSCAIVDLVKELPAIMIRALRIYFRFLGRSHQTIVHDE
jgi:hypothetical protein